MDPTGGCALEPCRRSASCHKVRDFPLWIPRDLTYLESNIGANNCKIFEKSSALSENVEGWLTNNMPAAGQVT